MSWDIELVFFNVSRNPILCSNVVVREAPKEAPDATVQAPGFPPPLKQIGSRVLNNATWRLLPCAWRLVLIELPATVIRGSIYKDRVFTPKWVNYI